MDAEIAWKRVKSIEKELEFLAAKLQPFVAEDKTHQQAVDALVQSMFEGLTGQTGKDHPPNWEHAHNHVLFCFRIYYINTELDPTFPAPVSPRPVVIPQERPIMPLETAAAATSDVKPRPAVVVPAVAASASPTSPAVATTPAAAPPKSQHRVTAAAPDRDQQAAGDRMTLLQEVRQHLDLLKEFEGVISADDLAQRKRELFLALPPAPPNNKRTKSEEV